MRCSFGIDLGGTIVKLAFLLNDACAYGAFQLAQDAFGK